MSRLRKILPWVLVVLWMALIFYLSHQPATESNELSTGITEIIIETVEKIAPDIDLDIGSFNHIIRKNAHFYIRRQNILNENGGYALGRRIPKNM